MKRSYQSVPSSLLLLFGLLLAFTPSARAIISVGSSGSGTVTFDALPDVGDWSTLSVAGGSADATSDATLDAAMVSVTASSINGVLGTQVGSGTAGAGYWRSGDLKLGSQPTGNKMTLIMAKLQNASGSTLPGLRVSYTLGVSVTPGEQIKGYRIYWSKTGAAGSWAPGGDQLITDPGSATVTCDIDPLNWANGESLYVVWADDNGRGTEGDFTIDDVSFTQAPPGASIVAFNFGLPDFGPTVISGTDISIDVPAGTDVTALKPSFTLSTGATCNKDNGGPTAYDFTMPQVYTVTSSDSLVTQSYNVSVNLKTVVDISGEIAINTVVGAGNFGRLVGSTVTFWSSQGFTVPIMLNENSLEVNSGGGNEPFYASGAISGNGQVSFAGSAYWGGLWDARIQVAGLKGNTYTGTTTVKSGTLSLKKPPGQNALCGTITVGRTSDTARMVWYASDQISDDADIILVSFDPGATYATRTTYLDLNGFSETIHSLTLPAFTTVKTGLGTGNHLRVATLTLDGTTYTTGAFGAAEAPGFVTGSGYILVGGTPPPSVLDPPAQPASPAPTNNATGIYPFQTSLGWADSLRATSYDLYLWLASDSKPVAPTANLTVSEYLPALLENNAHYKWQVVAKNSAGSTSGPEWTFTTCSRSDVSGEIVNPNYWIGAENNANLLGDTIFSWQTGTCGISVTNNGFTLELNSGNGNPFNYSGYITGAGGLRLAMGPYESDNLWNAPLHVGGEIGNDYAGPTVVLKGTIWLEKTVGNALCGPITVGTTTQPARILWQGDEQISDTSDVTLRFFDVGALVDRGTFLALNNHVETFGNFSMEAGTFIHTGDFGTLTCATLTVGGVPVPPGTYTAESAQTAGYIQGGGSVTVLRAVQPPVLTITSITGPDVDGKFTIHGTADQNTTVILLRSANIVPLSDPAWAAEGSPLSATANTPFSFVVPGGGNSSFFTLKVQ